MNVERIGRYEIIGELGEGGMAKVLRAHDPQFKRDVAIKVLPREVLFNHKYRERFEREAHTIAGLEHSAIVPVYDYGEADGQPYLVMREMRGGSLSDRIKEAPLDVLEAARIIERLASALDKAHARGIIHRDLKPANILFDEEGAPYLSDFGIVKVVEATTELTASGIIGTPNFMAPEMADGGKLSPQIDIYALGVTLFNMLSRQMPYEADTPMGMLMAHMNKPIPDIRLLRPDLPDEVHAIILRAMAKDPAQRYASAGELAQDLQIASSKPAYGAETVAFETKSSQSNLDPTVLSKPPRQVSRRTLPLGIAVGIMLIGAVLASMALINNMRGSTTTSTPSPTETATQAIVVTEETAEPITTDSPTKTPSPLGFWGNPVSTNSEWTPITQSFDDIEMALVPIGCARLGSESSDSNRTMSEQTSNLQCFTNPFWIDVYEVTNSQFERLGGEAIFDGGFVGDQQPRELVSYDEAQAFCEMRGARLPTANEWEYAARGPDSLIYPWGNVFIAENAVYLGNANAQTADVGSRPNGVSWVGAFDLAGNVFEWVKAIGSLDGGGHLMKGGSYCSDGQHLRAPATAKEFPQSDCANRGFRCARDWSPDD